jgi:NAD(P)H-dependent FMN reductase
MSEAPKSVAIITTSTRTPRIGPSVAAVVKSLLDAPAKESNVVLAHVDLADFNLPVYNESLVPAMIDPSKPDSPRFAHPQSIAWSDEIKRHDAYVLVIPEYNFGLTGGTKNAIDYLMHEWVGKPVAVISYGVQGGTWASAQAAHVLSNMKLRVAETKPQLGFAGGRGPEMFGAVLKGELGEETKKLWAGKEKKAQILEAFEQVKTMMLNPVPVPVEGGEKTEGEGEGEK